MDELDQLKSDIGKLVPNKLDEGRVFNNTGEMLRSMITDIKRVVNDVEEGMLDLPDVEDDLNDIIKYYMSAEIKQSPRY